MLSELRKYRLNLILAHQYLSQLEPEVRDAVFGNAGTFIAFRVGALDAPTVARVFEPTFGAEDLLSLPNYHIYLKLMICGEVGRGFSAVTMGRETDKLGRYLFTAAGTFRKGFTLDTRPR